MGKNLLFSIHDIDNGSKRFVENWKLVDLVATRLLCLGLIGINVNAA